MQRYTVERTLSKALFGDVVLCRDNATDASVAIKRMNVAAATAQVVMGEPSPRHVAEDIVFEKHVNAALMQRGHGHPNVLAMRHSFVEDSTEHFVFDYCTRGELFQVTETLPGHRVDRATARCYFQDIVRGVAYVHACGFAHRDLSLENVLVNAEGSCVVCDFGLAAPLGRSTRAKVGKPFYMAPEVVAGDVVDLAAADVWSLGVLLFVLLTGAPLVEVASMTDMRFQYLEAEGVCALIQSWEMDDLFDPQCMALLASMLTVDWRTRITVAEILQHPYLGGSGSNVEARGEDCTVERSESAALRALKAATRAIDMTTFIL